MTAEPTITRPLRIGARTSPLARAQAGVVAEALGALGVASQYVPITTQGDIDRRSLTVIGGTGVFVSAVRDALYAGDIDVAVHSLKDLPTAEAPGLHLAAVPPREDPRDVLVGARLADLKSGSRVGTGAPRRAMQLMEYASGRGLQLTVESIRGNVATRIDLVRAGAVDAVVLAYAGLKRLGLLSETPPEPAHTVGGLPAELLSSDVMLPAPGQGALALEVHQSLPTELLAALHRLDDPVSRAECLAERGLLARLEAGCTAPVGVRAHVKSVRGMSLDLTLDAVIGRTLHSNVSGSDKNGHPIRVSLCGATDDPAGFGAAVAVDLLTQL